MNARSRRLLFTLLVGLAALVQSAWAQQGRDGRPERPERTTRPDPAGAEAAWTWQARGIAHDLALDAEQTEQLVAAYVARRKALREAARAARADRPADEAEPDGRDRSRPGRRSFVDPAMAAEHRETLQRELATILPAGQAEQAAGALGSFNRQWDLMVSTVVGFGLEQEQTYAALTPISRYVSRLAGAMQLGDRRMMREIAMESRQALREDLGGVLSEEQMAAFREATSRRGGGRGGREQGPDRRRRGGAGGDQAGAVGIGRAAPAFRLPDGRGAEHGLADYAGRIVVLQWINPDCPVCRRTSESGKVDSMLRQLREIDRDVVYLAVNSTHYMEPGAGAAYFRANRIEAPVLVDREGVVGRLYGAQRTPHLYVIDADGVLRYQGAIDDDPSGEKGLAGATNYVVAAVRRIANGETVAPDLTRAYGCTVKFAPNPE